VIHGNLVDVAGACVAVGMFSCWPMKVTLARRPRIRQRNSPHGMIGAHTQELTTWPTKQH
jgi:hypothetical protein